LWLAVLVLAAPLATGGCSGDTLAGIPPAPAHAAGPAPAVVNEASAAELVHWDEKWRAIQARPESVALPDHWRVCEIKFRFRIYRDLFRCLDLIGARSDRDAREQQYGPVIIGWMRAEAYAELGQPVEALKWSESSWAALPQKYRDGSAIFDAGNNPLRVLTPVGALVGSLVFHDDFEAVAVEAGGSDWSDEGHGYELRQIGRHNPAGMDLRPQAIAMNLAAERALLHQQLGEYDQATAALQDLHQWRDRIPFISANKFAITASVLSLGPLFAIGNYAGVVNTYEQLAYMARIEQGEKTYHAILTLGPVIWATR
jgi:hypothetical protein